MCRDFLNRVSLIPMSRRNLSISDASTDWVVQTNEYQKGGRRIKKNDRWSTAAIQHKHSSATEDADIC